MNLPTITPEAAAVQAVQAWAEICERRGARAAIARGIGLQNLAGWKVVPLEYVFDVAAIMGADPSRLRPDFFYKDPARFPRASRTLTAETLARAAAGGRGHGAQVIVPRGILRRLRSEAAHNPLTSQHNKN